MRRKTQEEFIQQLRDVFGDKYDYSKTVYKGNRHKVIVTCKKHGDFEAFPYNLLKGHGCPIENRKYNNQDTFIEFCKRTYGDKYDYSNVVYNGSQKKVEIICNECGHHFFITPNNFVKGEKCPKCSKRYRYSTEDIIEEFKKIHGDKYDYSKALYKNMHESIIVICPEHGEFLIKPSSHLHKKAGCILCGYDSMKKKQRLTNEKVIEEFVHVHGLEKYDYSKVNYVNAFTNVLIHCNNHDFDFWQIPDAHKRGVGCPKCKESHLETEVENYLKNSQIMFFYDYRGSWLQGLTIDFYIPSRKLAIECQGEQHYIPVDFAGKGEEWAINMHNKVKERDILKRKICNENGIELIYFLDKKFLKYENSGTKCFTNKNELLSYLKSKTYESE